MKKIVFFFLLSSLSIASYCTTWTINNSGDTFVPPTLTIALGDSVSFVLESIHKPVEVSQATWNANGNTPLPGGFDLPFGGGLVTPAQLGAGIHYYVCAVHATLGMKGTITVQNNAGISINPLPVNISVFPNPARDLVTVKTDSGLNGSDFTITDLAGKQFLDGKLVNESTPVDISQLVPGIYLIQVTGQKKYSVKFIKN